MTKLPLELYIADPDLSNTTAGLVGEHLASAAILQRGWACSMAQQDAFDLIANKGRECYRVQVRSCCWSKRLGTQKQSTKSLQFPVGKGGNKRFPTGEDYDILALVSSEQRGCFFMPVSSVDKIKLTMPVSYFNSAEREIDSWDQTIRILRDELTQQTTMRNNRARNGSGSNCQLSPQNR